MINSILEMQYVDTRRRVCHPFESAFVFLLLSVDFLLWRSKPQIFTTSAWVSFLQNAMNDATTYRLRTT